MNDAQLQRYSRHLLLADWGVEGQERIMAGHALVVGLGGLGCPAALYLASAGIGKLTLADADTVEVSNLQRQILHTEARLGWAKVDSAVAALAEVNPEVEIIPLRERLAGAALRARVAAVDVVLDCSDNFATRDALNAAAQHCGKPLVSGAAVRFEGLVSVFDFRRAASPCYHCLFPEGADADAEARCAALGVFAPLTGVVGSLQAAEALKLLAGVGDSLHARLLRLDLLSGNLRTTSFSPDPACPVCAIHRDALRG
jgi:adenylyltransferase/sulfurtransferase